MPNLTEAEIAEIRTMTATPVKVKWKGDSDL
jgi:hypothetical protein